MRSYESNSRRLRITKYIRTYKNVIMGQVDDEDYERKQPQDLQAMLVQGPDRGGEKGFGGR